MSAGKPSRSERAGRRGRHRHVDSPETRAWHELAADAEWLDPAYVVPTVEPLPPVLPPACPGWLDRSEYEALLELRARVQEKSA